MIYGVRKKSSTGRRRTKAEILDSYYSNYKVKCECGHSIFMPYGTVKRICNYCGKYVYESKRIEFKEKMKKQLRRKSDE